MRFVKKDVSQLAHITQFLWKNTHELNFFKKKNTEKLIIKTLDSNWKE